MHNSLDSSNAARIASAADSAVGGKAAPRAGLVNLETSDTRAPLVIPASQLRDFNHRRRCTRMKKALIACADLQQRQLQSRASRWRAAFITLTYRPGCEYAPRHVSTCIKHLRQWCERRRWKMPYEWKAELQKRGAVHYHLLVWLPIALGIRALRLDDLHWWPHGMTNFQWARKDPVRYIAKYVSKAEHQEMPKGLRMHGRGGLDSECRRQVRYRLLPSYVAEYFSEKCDVVRADGGGWVDRFSGEWRAAIAIYIDWNA